MKDDFLDKMIEKLIISNILDSDHKETYKYNNLFLSLRSRHNT